MSLRFLYYKWREITTYAYSSPFYIIHITSYIFFHCPFLLLTVLFTFLVIACNHELNYRTSMNCLLTFLIIASCNLPLYYLLATKFLNVKLYSFNCSFLPRIFPPSFCYFCIYPCVYQNCHIFSSTLFRLLCLCVFCVRVYYPM